MAIRGTRRANRLDGTDDRDELIGDWGNDRLFGNGGDDLLIGDLNGDTSDRAAGNDQLFGGDGNDVLIGGRGDDLLVGGNGNDTLVGGYAEGYFSEDPASGPAIVYGSAVPAGNDSYNGGAGIDTAILQYRGDGAITLDMSVTNRAATIRRDGVDAGSIVNVEALVFLGGDGNDRVTAARVSAPFLIDTLDGGAGDDVLDGGGGIDLLIGGAGNDTLIGGGEDIASYEDRGLASDDMAGVTVDLRLNRQAQDTVGSGIDTLIGIRGLYGSGGSDVLIGNGSANEIIDRLSGDDRIEGGAGNDSLRIDRFLGTRATTTTIDGGVGNDALDFASNRNAAHSVTLIGGTGDDTIAVEGAARAVIDAGYGVDRVAVDTSAGLYQVTLGGGADTLILREAADATLREREVRVTDFATGDAGDKVDLRDWLSTAAVGYVSGDDPFGEYLKLGRRGDDVVLLADRDGAGDAYVFNTLVIFEDTRLQRFTDANFILPSAASAMDTFVSDFA
ncbi:calcium-binding protein [Sphingomonas sp. TZW2008]|uniref:calcium-binding protein n=1 Tax=Sphingomonas sp. TZW2008 TaxID=1917973 RepID=UPI000A270AA9|nr:calcium-binding protein [Sphingomonas sp. TZW2008]